MWIILNDVLSVTFILEKYFNLGTDQRFSNNEQTYKINGKSSKV